MNRCFILLLLSIVFIECTGQTLPEENKVDWHLAGNKTQFIASKIYNVKDFIAPDDGQNTDGAIKNILSKTKSDTAVLYFPNGEYYFSETIKLRSNIILRGQSTDSTILYFNLNSENDLIQIQGSAGEKTSLITADVLKNSTQFDVENTVGFSAGDYVKISDNDSDVITSDWAFGSTAQIVQITKIEGNTVYISSPLRRSFHISRRSKMLQLEMAQNVGIENLKIIRKDETQALTANISFNYTVNSYIKCVESQYCNYAHVAISNSSNISITGSYFHDAFKYGNGGKAYGVALQYSSGENLIKDNIFNNLRHSMLLQAGANGNVLAYNYSINPKWTDVMLPANSAGDIVLHGNYVYANLFEGNVVQNIVIDNSHGLNGPGNTFFRNRAELYGIVMNANAGGGQVFIGNEITNSDFFKGNFSLTGAGNYDYGNNRQGNISPQKPEKLTENSLFLKSAEVYYENKNAWPPIGYPNYKTHKIQAEAFFKDGLYVPCMLNIVPKDTIIKDTPIIKDTVETKDSTTTFIGELQNTKASVKLYPNPATDKINISITDKNVFIKETTVFNSAGKELINTGASNFDISSLKNGIYLVRIVLSSGSVSVHKFIKQSN